MEFLEKDQRSRTFEERELLQAFGGIGEPYETGRLFLSDNFVNSTAYWKSKLLNVQAIVYRRVLSSPFNTVTANTAGKLLGGLLSTFITVLPSLPSVESPEFAIDQIWSHESIPILQMT